MSAYSTRRTESTHHRLYEFAKTALIKIFIYPRCLFFLSISDWVLVIRRLERVRGRISLLRSFETNPCNDNLEIHLQDKAAQLCFETKQKARESGKVLVGEMMRTELQIQQHLYGSTSPRTRQYKWTRTEFWVQVLKIYVSPRHFDMMMKWNKDVN
ncbi:hypothetical protein SLE2022_110860 [Rubroshorea leprosula]